MRTIFALFEIHDEAKAAVAELIDRHFDEAEINAIVREPAVRTGPDAGVRERGTLRGMDRALIEGKSVIMPDVGTVRVAGRMAVMTAGTAAQELPPQGLKDVLAGLGVPEELAKFYCNGVVEGHLLLWVRSDEGKAAEAADVLSSTWAEKLANYA